MMFDYYLRQNRFKTLRFEIARYNNTFLKIKK